ncbi:MFS transporter [Nonomuraea pusilla]|uniref:Sugar phosphate permease n=1 Tax=Nonomuraea pusilla TaxID=46177 RepID=A0A1H7IAK0_9ACTN|nr:MFS transporter [Nonomuraea pusilla]SEK59509.1 Sugar phosphate permease [Nonomuraea pusilla]
MNDPPETAQDPGARRRPLAREEARAVLGVTGGAGDKPPLLRTLREHGTGLSFMAGLTALAVVDTFQTQAFGVLAPEVADGLGVDLGTITAVVGAHGVAAGVTPFAVAALLRRHPHRVRLAVGTGFAWSVATLFTGMVTGPASLAALMVVNGATTGTVALLHPPLLMDAYPPSARMRIMSLYSASAPVANILAPLVIAGLVTWLGMDWRAVFVTLGVLSLLVCLPTLRLREPVLGRWDVAELSARAGVDPPPAAGAPGFLATVRRVLLVPSIRRMAVGFTAIGALAVPYGVVISTLLERDWGLSAGQRGLFTSATAVVSIVALALFGGRAEAAYRAGPARFMALSGGALALAASAFALSALAPGLWLVLALLALGQALLAVVGPCLFIGGLSVVRPQDRAHAMAALGLILAAGGLLGAGLLGLTSSLFGLRGALLALLLPAVAGSLLIATLHKTLLRDLDALIDHAIGERTT